MESSSSDLENPYEHSEIRKQQQEQGNKTPSSNFVALATEVRTQAIIDQINDDQQESVARQKQQQQQQQQEQTKEVLSTTIKRPNLYEEIRVAISNAFYMYAFADIRDMAKNGYLNCSSNPDLIQKFINLPIDAYDFITIFQENKDIIEKRLDSKEFYEIFEVLFTIPDNNDEKKSNDDGDDDDDSSSSAEVYLRSLQMLHFDDMNANEECVFAIGINHIQKKVTVSFRGTVTPKDIIQDVKVLFTPIPNPVIKMIDDATKDLVDPLLIPRLRENVQVHLGFREYLYGEIPFNIKNFITKVQTASTANYKRLKKGTNYVLNKATDTFVSPITKTSKDVITRVTNIVCGTYNNNNQNEESQEDIINNSTTEEMKIKIDQTDIENNNVVIVENQKVRQDNLEKTTTETTTASCDSMKKKRYEVILDMVTATLKENPGYSLYVNGHSLGGALATMFAFEAAASDEKVIPKPVTCITTGAPKVGNLDYLHSFEVLEAQRKIRYIRVANFRDLVPLSPPSQTYNCISAMFCQGRRFRHVGIRLKLFPHGYVISYPPKARSCPGILLCDMIKIIRHYFYLLLICPIVCFCKNRYVYKTFRSEHTQLVYMSRLNACAEELSDMYLDELYEERKLRSRMQLPTLHGSTHALRKKDDYKNDPSKLLFTILEV